MWHTVLLHTAQTNILGMFVSRAHFNPNVIRSLFTGSLLPLKIAGIAALPVVKNKAMTEIYSLAKRISASSIPVLIIGETGAGKEVLARYIHDNSGGEREGEFVALNCGAIQESLMDSELFGHVKGAFTSADKDKVGLIEVADGGTLFLDEVEEINHTMQVKLLRVIEEKEYRRLGSAEIRRSNFRLICATNRDLQLMIDQGDIREDFYHRISIAVIEVRPLRERIDEIPCFVDYFIQESSSTQEAALRKRIDISGEVMELFLCYHWPGNIRELRNVIDYAMNALDEDEGTIELRHLPPGKFHCESLDGNSSMNLKNREKCFRESVIRQMMVIYEGDHKKIMQALGVSKNTIYRAMNGGGGQKWERRKRKKVSFEFSV